jgi:hypothetical protein
VSLPLLISCRVAVVFAIQSWLAESPEQRRTSSTPAYFQVGMSGKSRELKVYSGANGFLVMSLLVVCLLACNTSGRKLIMCHRVTPRCCFRPRQAVQEWQLVQRHQELYLRHDASACVTKVRSRGLVYLSCNCIIEKQRRALGFT